jgi:ComF family protein
VLVTRAASLGYDALLTLVYPQACGVCGGSVERRDSGVACVRCWQMSKIFSGSEKVCWKCGRPSVGFVAAELREEVRCHRCDDAHFTAARACGVYEGALRALVLNLKREPSVCQKLVTELVRTQQREPLNLATRIIPVPLHPSREHERGFNQAALLGEALANATSLPLDLVSLIRVKRCERHRAGMDAKGRNDTVAGAFEVLYPALVEGERILLIDDVFTTGATVSACAQALRSAGALDVLVLTAVSRFL